MIVLTTSPRCGAKITRAEPSADVAKVALSGSLLGQAFLSVLLT